MITFIYLAIAVGCFRSFYEKLQDNAGARDFIAAGITAVVWPVYWAYRITEVLDPKNK